MPLWAPALAVALLAALFLLLRALLLQPPTLRVWADPTEPIADQPVAIYWEGNRIRHLELGPLPGESAPIELTPSNSGVYTIEQGLSADTTVRLFAANFLGDPTVDEPVDIAVRFNVPVVAAWDVSPTEIMEGESVTVTWLVSDAQDVKITWLMDDEAEGEARTLGSGPTGVKRVAPQGTQRTVFYLQATNNGNQPDRVRPLTVRYLKPVVNEWSVSPAEIMQRESVTLTWDVANSDNIAIRWRPENSQRYSSASLNQVGPTGIEMIQLDDAQTYIIELTATNGDQSERLFEAVKVLPPPPLIRAFDVEPDEFVRWSRESVTLTWQTEGAQTVEIEVDTTGSSEDRTLSPRLTSDQKDDDAPEQDTTYRLVATGPGGVGTREVRVRVSEPVCTVKVDNSRLRDGPGTNYKIVGTVSLDSRLDPQQIAPSEYSDWGSYSWLLVKTDINGRTITGWVADSLIDNCTPGISQIPTVDVASIPSAPPTGTPTPTPTATATATTHRRPLSRLHLRQHPQASPHRRSRRRPHQLRRHRRQRSHPPSHPHRPV